MDMPGRSSDQRSVEKALKMWGTGRKLLSRNEVFRWNPAVAAGAWTRAHADVPASQVAADYRDLRSCGDVEYTTAFRSAEEIAVARSQRHHPTATEGMGGRPLLKDKDGCSDRAQQPENDPRLFRPSLRCKGCGRDSGRTSG